MLLLPPPPRWLVLAAKETNGILTQASLSVLHAFSAKIALSRLELRKLAQRMSHHLPHPSQRITCFFALNYWIHLRGSYRQQALGLFCPLDPDVCPNPLLGLTPPRPSPLQTVFEPSVLEKVLFHPCTLLIGLAMILLLELSSRKLRHRPSHPSRSRVRFFVSGETPGPPFFRYTLWLPGHGQLL
ncbi:hypothetical protein B0H13DRAFT_683935 [Mycena leptocephala]|nr:hypothetical protein B0H13DRAFT_683935 [Mycena leptocephala]